MSFGNDCAVHALCFTLEVTDLSNKMTDYKYSKFLDKFYQFFEQGFQVNSYSKW